MKIKPRMITLSSPTKHRWRALRMVHANNIALCLRAAMLFGFVIVIIGRARTGKTLILNRITPGKVVCKLDQLINSPVAVRPTLSVSELPKGIFSIDEMALYEPSSLKKTISNLADRSFALSIQHPSDILELGLDEILANRRRLIVTLE